MPRRKRTAARSRYDPADFITSDGWKEYDFDATPLLGSLREAQAEWERLRAATWAIWVEWHGSSVGPYPHPPLAATAHDGIDGSLESVAEFRRRRPRAAAEIADALELYEHHLRWEADERERRPKASNAPPLYGPSPSHDEQEIA